MSFFQGVLKHEEQTKKTKELKRFRLEFVTELASVYEDKQRSWAERETI